MQHSTASSIGSLSTQNLTLRNPFACALLGVLSSHYEDGADSFQCCVSKQGQRQQFPFSLPTVSTVHLFEIRACPCARKKTEAGSDRGKTEQWWFAVGEFFFVVSGCLCLGFALLGSLFGVRNVFESRLFVLLMGELSWWFIQRIGWKPNMPLWGGCCVESGKNN
ncbi:hypothetical protein VIGAN_05254600 [Vigna angularis var. angularis]|uniref:Transmembrane protein n=1 Tax=Vigna angularis var. angularis TaxID=157739 RepID=A0A0S3S7V9_PHAAN|nr:hypothetical protein VIGAN_05254600 [Vigna angularis var. angularis]